MAQMETLILERQVEICLEKRVGRAKSTGQFLQRLMATKAQGHSVNWRRGGTSIWSAFAAEVMVLWPGR